MFQEILAGENSSQAPDVAGHDATAETVASASQGQPVPIQGREDGPRLQESNDAHTGQSNDAHTGQFAELVSVK